MKKISRSLLLSFFLILFLMLSIVPDVSAENKLLIKEYNGLANILSNGDMNYQETFTYKFKGYWNGVTIGIKPESGSTFKNLKVSDETIEYTLKNDAEKGDAGV
ncbi:MAG: DUF2207 domain-containing protein, partial [Clostridiaceae bacterium]